MPAVMTVTNLMDGTLASLAGDGQLSLREAIEAINTAQIVDGIAPTSGSFGMDDRIVFQSSLAGPLQLANVSGTTPGQLDILKSVVIEGRSDASQIVIHAFDPKPSTPVDGISTNDGDGGRIFDVHNTTDATIAVSIKGLTLTGGDVGTSDGGGAIRLINQSLTIDDVAIVGNSSFATTNLGKGGGAIAASLTVGTSLVITDSVINSNFAEGRNGGALLIDLASGGDVLISSCVFQGNKALKDGGAISLSGGSTAISRTFEFRDSAVTDNFAGFGQFDSGIVSSGSGGGVNAGGTVPVNNTTIRGVTFAENTASQDGGGIVATATGSGIEIVNTTISDNRAQNGGGIWMGGNVTLKHSTVTTNTAGPFTGTALTGGGGVFIRGDVVNNVNPSIDHSIIAGNQHLQNEPGGNNLHNFTPDVGVILPVSTTFTWPGDFFPPHTAAPPPDPLTSLMINFTIIGNQAGPISDPLVDPGEKLVTPLGTGHLFNVDPLLGTLTGDNGGFELPDGSVIRTQAPRYEPGAGVVSPAIDAGDPSITIGGVGVVPYFDERGLNWLRVVDLIPGGARIDIGAVEVQPAPVAPCPLPGDYNANGIVDAADYTVWQDNRGSSTLLPNDVTPGNVGSSDFDVWKMHFGETCNMPGSGQSGMAGSSDEKVLPHVLSEQWNSTVTIYDQPIEAVDCICAIAEKQLTAPHKLLLRNHAAFHVATQQLELLNCMNRYSVHKVESLYESASSNAIDECFEQLSSDEVQINFANALTTMS